MHEERNRVDLVSHVRREVRGPQCLLELRRRASIDRVKPAVTIGRELEALRDLLVDGHGGRRRWRRRRRPWSL